jgi:hypothetical protein
LRDVYTASLKVHDPSKLSASYNGVLQSSSTPFRRLAPPLDEPRVIGLSVCSLLTFIWNTSIDKRAASCCRRIPPSYAQTVMIGSVGSLITPSVERNPREAFAKAEIQSVIRSVAPTLGENTPWDALTAVPESGVDVVLRLSARPPRSSLMRDVGFAVSATNSAPETCCPVTFVFVESRRRPVVK